MKVDQKENRISCPHCSELIMATARKCRFCGEWLNSHEATSKKLPLWRSKILIFGIILLIFWFFLNSSSPKSNLTSSSNEIGLKQTIDRQYKLLNTEEGIREIYNNYLSPDQKSKLTEEEYVEDFHKGQKEFGNFSKVTVHSVVVRGNVGYVDRTITSCDDPSCSKINISSRLFKKYVYHENKWLMSEGVFCPRTEMYDMAPEFKRSIELIIQRLNGQMKDIEDIANCISVRYASSESEMLDAEGVFKFIPNQSSEKLEIIVSPRYATKDDLITSVLLMHEMSHVRDYVYSQFYSTPLDCFKTEAGAFQNQNWFISLLNQEETYSINARLNSGGSEELRSIKYVWDGIARASGSTNDERALNYVKSQQFYIKQCASN